MNDPETPYDERETVYKHRFWLGDDVTKTFTGEDDLQQHASDIKLFVNGATCHVVTGDQQLRDTDVLVAGNALHFPTPPPRRARIECVYAVTNRPAVVVDYGKLAIRYPADMSEERHLQRANNRVCQTVDRRAIGDSVMFRLFDAHHQTIAILNGTVISAPQLVYIGRIVEAENPVVVYAILGEDHYIRSIATTALDDPGTALET